MSALGQTTDAWTPRQYRHLSYVAEYTSDVRHIPGADNVVANMLSCPPAAISQSPASTQECIAAIPAATGAWVDFVAMAREQHKCTKTLQASKSPTLSIQTRVVDGASLWCEMSATATRPLVPLTHRRWVFQAMHDLAHPGIRATRQLIAARFLCPT